MRITDIKSVKLEFLENPEQSLIVNNSGNSITLNPLKDNIALTAIDTLRLLDFITSFDNIRFEALLNNLDIMDKDSIISSTPFHIITLTNKSGDQFIVKTFHKYASGEELDLEGNPVLYDRDRLYAMVNDDRDFVLIQFFVFDKILRPLSYFTAH